MSGFTPPSTLTYPTVIGTVLVVDDDHETTKQFAQMLRLAGYRVYTAVDPVAGLHHAMARDLDAIILDFRMPFIDGVRFLRQLRRYPAGRDVRVAIVTGDYLIDEKIVSEAHALCARVVFKPLWLDDLVSLTASLVEAKQAAAVSLVHEKKGAHHERVASPATISR